MSDIREVDLLSLLPQFMTEYHEIYRIMQAENPEFELYAQQQEQAKDNTFITTCNENGIARFEKLLGIKPTAQDTLASRISRVLIRWNDVVPYTWRVFLSKMVSLCGSDFETHPDWDNYQVQIITHLDLFGQTDELDNIIDYMFPANILVDAQNQLNYTLDGNAYVAVGQAFADMFTLTDSFNVNWTVNAQAGAAATGAGSCEIMMTDSFQGAVFGLNADAGGAVSPSFADQIEVTDSSQGTINVGSAANTGSSINYTTII